MPGKNLMNARYRYGIKVKRTRTIARMGAKLNSKVEVLKEVDRPISAVLRIPKFMFMPTVSIFGRSTGLSLPLAVV